MTSSRDVDTTKRPTGHMGAFGPFVLFMTELTPEKNGYCLAHCIFPSGAVVPVHSHEDRETFYVISGELEGWDGGEWKTLRGSDVFEVPGHRRHAFRNRSGQDAVALLVTTSNMGRFFGEIMHQPTAAPPSPPTPEARARIAEVAARYRYWMGSPDDNANAGLG